MQHQPSLNKKYGGCGRGQGSTSSTDLKEELMATPRKQRNSTNRTKLKKFLLNKYGHRCWLCGTARKRRDLTVDHILPLNLNGEDERENMKLACSDCNGKRGAAVTRLMIPELHRKRIYTQFDLMLSRYTFVGRQLDNILKERK